jgi:hypothetical protein
MLFYDKLYLPIDPVATNVPMFSINKIRGSVG